MLAALVLSAAQPRAGISTALQDNTLLLQLQHSDRRLMLNTADQLLIRGITRVLRKHC